MIETSASTVTINPQSDYIIAASPLAVKYFERFNVMMNRLLKENPEALTAWNELADKGPLGLQLMTRTQAINTTGYIDFDFLNSEFDEKMIEALGPVEWLEIKRCLTALNRLTMGASKQTAYQTGFKGDKLTKPAEVVCIDSAGSQYQLYDYNSGPMLTVNNEGTTDRNFLRNPVTKKIMDELYEELSQEFAAEIKALGIEKTNGVLNQHNYVAIQAQDLISQLSILKGFEVDFFVNAKSGGGFFSDDALAEIYDPLWNPPEIEMKAKSAEPYIQHLIWQGLTVGLMRLKNDPQLQEAILKDVTIRLPFFEDSVPKMVTPDQKQALARDREAFLALAKELGVKVIVDKKDVFDAQANQNRTVGSTTSADSITIFGDEAYAVYAPRIGKAIFDIIKVMEATDPRQYFISQRYEAALKEKLFLFELLDGDHLKQEEIQAIYKKYGKEGKGNLDEITAIQNQACSLPYDENAYMEYQRAIDFVEELNDPALKGKLSSIITEANKFCGKDAKSLDSAIARNISLGGVMKANPHTNIKAKPVAIENGKLIDFETRRAEIKSANADILKSDDELSSEYAKKLKAQKQQDIEDAKKTIQERVPYHNKNPLEKLNHQLDRMDALLAQDNSNNPRYAQELRRCRQQIQLLEQREPDVKVELVTDEKLQKRYLDTTKKADKIIEGPKIRPEFISKLDEIEKLASSLEADTGNAYESVYKQQNDLQKLVDRGALEGADDTLKDRYAALTEKINQRSSAESVVVKNILMDSILGKSIDEQFKIDIKQKIKVSDLLKTQNDKYSKDVGDLKTSYTALRQFAEQNKNAVDKNDIKELKGFIEEYVERRVKNISLNVLAGKELTHKELAELKDLVSLLEEHQKLVALNADFKQEGSLDALKTVLEIKIHGYEKLEAVIDKKTADAEGPRKLWIGTKSRQVIADCREGQKRIFQAGNMEQLEKARVFLDGKKGDSKSLKGAMEGPDGINSKFAPPPAGGQEGERRGSHSSHKSSSS